MEGQHNELADWGLSRDKKTGKKQVVIGLLCDEGGDPVSVEVFRGNVRDFSTLGSQIEKAAKEFGCHRVTFVGDRGMIKSGQISQIKEAEFHYITAITKPQIDKLLRGGVFQMALFDKDLNPWHIICLLGSQAGLCCISETSMAQCRLGHDQSQHLEPSSSFGLGIDHIPVRFGTYFSFLVEQN
jgi:hypothetical protein